MCSCGCLRWLAEATRSHSFVAKPELAPPYYWPYDVAVRYARPYYAISSPNETSEARLSMDDRTREG
nr:hypothetical protein CFP56_13232 [Quercus suber]